MVFICFLRMVSGLFEPASLVGILILANAAAALARYRRLAVALQGITAAFIVLFGIMPGGVWLISPLEARFPPNPMLPDHVAGIVVLGGTERLAQSEAWHQPTLSDPTPIAAALALSRRYPEAKLVFSGGGTHPGRAITEAQVVRDFLAEIGVDGARILYEDRSRNTRENAIFSQELALPAKGEWWILVSQASSLPRAVGAFRGAGWNVIPFPAGYLTDGRPHFSFLVHLAGELSLASLAVHEWGGLLVYRWAGYTDQLFPGPR